MKKIIASVAALAVALTSCQTNAVEDESRQENSCARGDAQSCALLGDFHERDKTKTGRHDYAKAVEFYGKACALNEYAACADAARIHSFFRVDADSGKKVKTYAQKACDANIAGGCSHLAGIYLGMERDVMKAFALAEKACAENHGFACDWLGGMYQSGDGAAKDPDAAKRLFVKAAEFYRQECDKGYLFYCFRLGLFYDTGLGVEKDAARAISLYQQACDAKIAPACEELFLSYACDKNAERDEGKAAQYREKACDADDSGACFLLGMAYSNAYDGITKNEAKAASLWQKGCDLNDDASCERLGDLYMEGAKGVVRDTQRGAAFHAKTFALQKKGCENDKYPDACRDLGETYEEGKIVPRDLALSATAYDMALLQWRRECDNDDYMSCFALARMYESGKGVAKDIPQALKYYDKACQQYYPGCLFGKSLSEKSE